MVESVFADCLEMLWWFTWDNTFIYKIVLLIFWFLFVWLIFWFLFAAIINYLQKPTDIINRKRPFSVWFPYTAIERLWCQLEELIRSGYMVDQCNKLKKLLHGTLLSHLKLVCLYCISTAIFKFKFNSVVSFYKLLDLVFKFQLKVDSDDAISAASSWGLSASKTGMLCTIKIQRLLHGAASNVYFQMFYICLGSQFVESLTAGCTKNGPYYMLWGGGKEKYWIIEAVQLDEFLPSPPPPAGGDVCNILSS